MADRTAPTIVPLCDLRVSPGATMDRVLREARPLFLSRRGRICAVLLGIDAYDALLAGSHPASGAPATERSGERSGEQSPRLELAVSASDGEDATRVLAAIQAGHGLLPDSLVAATGLSVPRVKVALTVLQLNGLVDVSGFSRRK
ncbi:MAG: hypothetical protein AMXMBFR56_44180 [Polyangiaceae bacterium]